MKSRITIFFVSVLVCIGCDFKMQSVEQEHASLSVPIQRYDRLETRFLTTGDYSALQQMNTNYPRQTRTLLEDILALGEVNDASIHSRFLSLFQDTLLQEVITDVELKYANVDDLEKQLSAAFDQLRKWFPSMEMPHVYAQISALDQSIVVGGNMIGISLDKYLGSDYPLYDRFYSEQQKSTMKRSYIVPDCLCFYILSMYPLDGFEESSQEVRDIHMGRVMWVANKAMGKRFFKSPAVEKIEAFMKKSPKMSKKKLMDVKAEELL